MRRAQCTNICFESSLYCANWSLCLFQRPIRQRYSASWLSLDSVELKCAFWVLYELFIFDWILRADEPELKLVTSASKRDFARKFGVFPFCGDICKQKAGQLYWRRLHYIVH